MSRRNISIGVRSMYGAKTEQPLVILHVGDEAPQLTPTDARKIGHWLIEAAESAEHDAALLHFCEEMELDRRFAVGIMGRLRDARGSGSHDMEVESE